MEREPILSVVPPADISRPLLVPSIVDESMDENSDNDFKFQSLNQIFAKPVVTNIKNIRKPNSTPPPILLSTFPSIHEDLTMGSEDNQAYQGDYQPLPDDYNDSALYEFLASLRITRQQIDHAQIPQATLLKLYQQEFFCISWMKWSSLDHAIEKHLQWPLLSPADVGQEHHKLAIIASDRMSGPFYSRPPGD